MKLNKALYGLISISTIPFTSISCEVSISNSADVEIANEEQSRINMQAHDGDEHVLMEWNPTNDFKVRDEYVDDILASMGITKNTSNNLYGYWVVAKNVIYPTNSTGGSFNANVIATYNGDANEATLVPIPRKVYFVSVAGAMQEQDVLNAAKNIKGNNYPSSGMVTLNSSLTFDELQPADVTTPQTFNGDTLVDYGLSASQENNSTSTFPSLTNTFKTTLKYTFVTSGELGSILTIHVSKEGTSVVSQIQYKINFKSN